ncbi:hypothetical protein Pcinc_023865 [Petrolisthes cinctipes]|uniref:Uncharacterized protein n=1 Tax=Petrolisthes cinctipes TaxID=88211 RepID=A0AAE1FBK2_PETCI|nr:hypothetical protein Pcinc_023865 [Petrolisthes cinctipes]
MDGMENLQKAQAAAQGWLTRVCTKMEGLLVKSTPATSSELIEVLEEFDKRLTKLEEVQSDLELELRPEALDEYLDKADEARQRAKHMRLLCADKLKELTLDDKVDSVSTIASLHARLPKLELPRFDGDLKHWQSFWEQFSSHIEDTELPTISKLTYLLSLLDGTAKDVVEGVPHTSASYKTVVDLLKQRFGKTACIYPRTRPSSSRSTSSSRPGQDLHHTAVETSGRGGQAYSKLRSPGNYRQAM